MVNERYTLYFVVFKFRLKKNFKRERWKKKYRWQSDALYARCHHRFQVEGLVKDKILEKREGEYQIKIVEVSKVKIPKQEAAAQPESNVETI